MTINLKKLYSKIYFLLIFMPLFLFSAFRNGLGTDYVGYAYAFNYPGDQPFEFLFTLLFITIPRLISRNEIIFFIFTSFIISLFFLKTIFRYSPIISLSIVIYITQFYFSSYNLVRQFIVIAIFLYFGSKYLIEKRYCLYYFLIILLAQIHYSMYFMLVFPLLGSNDHKKYFYWVIWFVSILLFLMQSYNIINLSNMFLIAPNLNFLSEKFNLVVDAANFFYGKYEGSVQLIVKNIFCVIFLSRLEYFKGSNKIYWINLFLFGVLLNNVLFKFSLYAVRISYIGDAALLILVPFFINSFKNKKQRLALIMFFVIYFSYNFHYRFIVNGESEVFKQGLGQEWDIKNSANTKLELLRGGLKNSCN